jgi:hypothetical protein
MSWVRFITVIVAATALTSLSDWVFSGLIFHDKALASPDIWRPGGQEGMLIAWSQLIGVVSSVAFLALVVVTRSLTLRGVLVFAVLAWLAGPVVVIGQTVIWTKLHPLAGASQSLAWLIRFVVTGLLAVVPVGRGSPGAPTRPRSR